MSMQCCPKRFSIKTKKGSKEGVSKFTPSFKISQRGCVKIHTLF